MILLFAYTPPSSSCRISVFVFATSALVSKGFSSKEFCDSLTVALGGGKSGGKAELANGSFPVSETVTIAKIKALATQYLQAKNVSFI